MADDVSSAPSLYFVSDVHLGVGSPVWERETLRRLDLLLREVGSEQAALFIVGDLFDFWYEYRHVTPRGYHRLLTALEDLTRAGCPVTYLAGNHDFGIGRTFEDLGMRVERDDLSFQHDGARYWVFHGDGLAVRDGGYRALKRVLRNPAAQWAFRWLHPDLGFALARRFSHGSRGYTSGKDYGEVDGMRQEARRRIHDGSDVVVMGHRHIPRLERIDHGLYVNLGDWLKHYTFAIGRGSSLSLHSLASGRPEPYTVTA